jgi:hypothetical protein
MSLTFAAQGDVERGCGRILSILGRLQGCPRHNLTRTGRGAGGIRGIGRSSYSQTLVRRSNRNGHNISSVIGKKLEICWSTRTMALSEREFCFIEDDVPGNDDSIR